MPRIADNAEAYASTRLGIFFPAHNQTPADGNLTGQCVTLNKWFLAEMTDVPSPFAARGDARYVGQTLVNQGHAVKVPYNERRRGDFAVFEYGQWGHIGVLLDQDRIFEQNVNVGGVARRFVDGAYVYASRIGRLSESWRPVQATIYRIKSYNEKQQGVDDMIPDQDNYYWRWGKKNAFFFRGRELSREEFSKYIAGRGGTTATEILGDNPEADQTAADIRLGQLARKDNWQGQIYGLIDQVNNLNKRPTAEQYAAIQKAAADLQTTTDNAVKESAQAKEDAKKLRDELAAMEAEKQKDQETGNAFLRWLGDQLNKLLGRG